MRIIPWKKGTNYNFLEKMTLVSGKKSWKFFENIEG